MQRVKIISGSLYYLGGRKDPRRLDDDINAWLEKERPKSFTLLPLSTIDGYGNAYATIIYEPGEKLKESNITVNGKKVRLIGQNRLSFMEIVSMTTEKGDVFTIGDSQVPIDSFRVTYETLGDPPTSGTIPPGGSIEVSDDLRLNVYGVTDIR